MRIKLIGLLAALLGFVGSLAPERVLAADPAIMSDAFKRFAYSFFEDPTSAQDALDTASLATLQGDERTLAEDKLVAFLPDSRAVIGLGVLRSKKAEPLLKQLFDDELKEQAAAARDGQQQDEYNPLGLLFLVRALWLIEPDPRWPVPAIEVLGAAHEWVHRQEAAEALSVMHVPEAVAALTNGLDDKEALVRFSAARGLFAIYGLSYDIKDTQSAVYRVMADDAARHADGKRDVLAAVAGRAMAR
jgi:HEAT repeat protein